VCPFEENVMSKTTPGTIVDVVKERYGAIAEGKAFGTCCGGASSELLAVGMGYEAADLATLPDEANLGLGCGAPIAHLDLKAGETVVDLGSGAGIDVFLAARAVGPKGRVIGVDMTPAMLAKARANAARAGFTQVEFREGRLEALPVVDSSVDAVTSNCVINLVPDKAVVFREIARILKPGGRVAISDIVLDAPLPDAVVKDVYAYVGCIAGAVLREEYLAMLRQAGFDQVTIVKDLDYLAAAGDALEDPVADSLRRNGLSRADIAGRVRSITFRAAKR
jgi:ubiquinone/menaquinone biosynthesis C-methylase UbiE